ncbi:MAG: DUF4157 domain-containing protein [Nitrospira sp.]|nr:DUF4157 domain-containing protein [Nitrospira sp.]
MNPRMQALTQVAPTPFFMPVPRGILQRKCACGTHMMGGGQCTDCAKKKSSLQRKLAIGASNDPLEQEADRVANQVMARPARSYVNSVSPHIQRFLGHATEQAGQAPASVDRVLASSGRPLEPSVQHEMGQRFGCDFSQVQVHTGKDAEQSAREVNAHAYTVGHDIVFGAGQFAPGTNTGQRLIAHELMHVVQQAGNGSGQVQRQPEVEKKQPKSDLGKELKKNELFQKLPDIAQEKILDEIDKAPETVTKAIFDKIIDLSPIDEQYKEGLKKVGEAIIKSITGGKPPSTSICDVPGYHEGKSSAYKGMCCRGSIESAMGCCPKDKFAYNDPLFCCKADEFVNADNKCEKFSGTTPITPCLPPGKKDALGKCCMPPFQVIQGICTSPLPKPSSPAQPLSLNFTLGVIDDFDIDKSVLNSRQQPQYDKVKSEILRILETCPATVVTVTGFADKPGTEAHNQDLGQRRADHVKFLLNLDLIKLAIGPLIIARSEGENKPADVAAGEEFSARNRRVEVEINSQCPPLGSLSLSKPAPEMPFRPTFLRRSIAGDFR